MKISILDRCTALTNETREFSKRRLLFALARFDSRIQQVTALISDVNGPRGGVDKSCQITVKLRRLAPVRVEGEDADIRACVARTADRVGRAVARAIDRDRQFRRSHSMSPPRQTIQPDRP